MFETKRSPMPMFKMLEATAEDILTIWKSTDTVLLSTDETHALLSVSRRKLLQLSGGVGLSGILGCLGSAIDPGTLVITNNDDRPHTVTVVIMKTSDSDEAVPSRPHEAQGPTTTPHWQRESRFEVAAGAERTRSEFLTEPGAYYIKATTATGVSDTNWLGLYSAGSNGEQVAESFIAITISGDETLSISTPTDD